MTSFSETFKGWFSSGGNETTKEVEISYNDELRTCISFANTGLTAPEALAVVDRELGYKLEEVTMCDHQRVIDAYNNKALTVIKARSYWRIVEKKVDERVVIDSFLKEFATVKASGKLVDKDGEFNSKAYEAVAKDLDKLFGIKEELPFSEECTCDDSDCTCQPSDDEPSEEELAYFHDTYPAIFVREEHSSPKESTTKHYANRDSLGEQIHVGDTVTVNSKYAIVTLVTPSVLYVRMTNEKSTNKYLKTSKARFYCVSSDTNATIFKTSSLLKGLLEFEISNGCVVASIAYNHSWEQVLYAIWLYVNGYTSTEDGKDLSIDSTGMRVYTADTDRELRKCIGHPYPIPADDKAAQALIDSIFTSITTLYNKTIKELKYEFRKKCFYVNEATKRQAKIDSFKTFCHKQHISVR